MLLTVWFLKRFTFSTYTGDSRYVESNRTTSSWHSGPPSTKSFNSVPSSGTRDPRNEPSSWSSRSSEGVNRYYAISLLLSPRSNAQRIDASIEERIDRFQVEQFEQHGKHIETSSTTDLSKRPYTIYGADGTWNNAVLRPLRSV